MIGTLYGTLEVAGSLAVEMAACVRQDLAARHAQRIKRIAVIWCAAGVFAILLWLCRYQLLGGAGKPRLLLAILTPANVLTGVLGCGLLCALNLWMDRRYLPAHAAVSMVVVVREPRCRVRVGGRRTSRVLEQYEPLVRLGGLGILLLISLIARYLLVRRPDCSPRHGVGGGIPPRTVRRRLG